ncbi:MAG TPA: SusC/RagA family TonB-linked outer membrane protein [Chitinophagaceae bacterium]|nr:SusC/RagA family TonB-linked outer membrane protein [Chitinophagaceae bacterium]
MRKLLLMFSLLVLCAAATIAQQRQVKGKVTDKAGAPISGATVHIKGTNLGTSAAPDGSFSLLAKTGDVLEISAVNFSSLTVKVGNSPEIGSIELDVQENLMDEVVVTAGGIQRKKREEGYAATRITGQQLTQAKPVNVAAGLSGKVAGLQVNAINGGVNPTVRLVLRGNRSLLGNNTALIVIDNVIVPSEILGNINPEDIEDINVLNGAGAAALYGSDASNGAIIITTKKGAKGSSFVRLSNTTTIEKTSFYPKLQKEFGSGWETGAFTPYENQQYGPRFDGTMRQLGREDINGDIQTYPYIALDDREKFWVTGLTNQSDIALSAADDRSSYYISGQFATIKGTTPKDKYNRAQMRFNGSRKISKAISVNYSINYIQNRYDLTTQTSTIYNNLLNTPAWAPLKSFQNWQTDKWASPELYYNDYYLNPYFYVDNYRQKTRNDYLTGNVEFSWKPATWIDVVYRAGLTTRNQSAKSWVGMYSFKDAFYKRGGKSSWNWPGSVSDDMFYSTQINSDLLITVRKRLNDVGLELTAGQSLRNNVSKSTNTNVSGLVIPGLYNVSNRTAALPNSSESNSTVRQMGIFGKFKVSYKNWLFLDITGRNDWRSVLDPEHWSFFYPAVDLSFVASDAIEAIKNSKVINNLKLRGGVSKVGNVNLGAYGLLNTFDNAPGYPYAVSGPGYSVNGLTVNPSLKPEITRGWEVGMDMDLLDRKINFGVTYYSTITDAQTVNTQISQASGFSTYKTNTGEVSNKGLEVLLHYTPIRTRDLTVTVGGNYTYNKNLVLSISEDLEKLNLSTGAAAQTIAKAGYLFPILEGSDYLRDDQGRIIVDRITGYPSRDPIPKLLGNTNPKHRLGLDAEVRFKNFRLWALAEYRGGFVVYHNGGGTMDFSGSSSRTVAFNRERFVIPNSSYWDGAKYVENTSVQVRDGGSGFWADGEGAYNTVIATNYIIKGDYWKVREISLTYDLPKKVIAKAKFLKAASIGIQGRNLFIFTAKSNIYTDPEYNFSDGNAIGITTLGQTPPSRYFGGTISLTF